MAKAKRAKGTGSVYSRPRSPFYWISFHQNGKLVRESTGTDNKTKAQNMLTKRLQEVNAGTYNPDADKITVADIVQHVFNDYRKNHPNSLPNLKSKWHPECGAGKGRHGQRTSLKSFFAHLRCNQVNYKLLERYQSIRLQEGAAGGQINRELNILKVAFKYGIKAGELTTKPQFPSNFKERARVGFLTDADYLAFADATLKVKGGGLWLRTAFEIAFTYGWRKREILNLRLRNVDLFERVLRLEPHQTKTGRGRIAPMTDLVFNLISECVKGKTNPDDYVLTRFGNKPIRTFWDSWRRVAEMAGKPDTIFHDLRRSAVSSLVRKGVSRKVAMTISGHETESIFNRYHITETEDITKAVQTVATKRAENLKELDKTHLSHTQPTIPTQTPDESTTSKTVH
jgi:integrase